MKKFEKKMKNGVKKLKDIFEGTDETKKPKPKRNLSRFYMGLIIFGITIGIFMLALFLLLVLG